MSFFIHPASRDIPLSGPARLPYGQPLQTNREKMYQISAVDSLHASIILSCPLEKNNYKSGKTMLFYISHID
jgi:hypothetical protein